MKYSQNQAILASVVVLGLLLSPVIQNWVNKPKDNFPLSYYPMFSMKRGVTYGVYHLVGYDEAQNRYHIPYRLTGTGGFNQVRRQIKKAARSENAAEFTKQVAQKIAKKKKEPYTKINRVELVRGYYHLENYFLKKDTLPVREKKIAHYNIKK
ncbi:hypothetical protein [Aquimarina algicola]|uniref:Uncharacterized protein n=1 Tax=Aquimarina algicola TaxID=2589995 RepID=A0A504J3I4_9FLAO|nr:hypothetical protein [Aquimarina algicola]TPN83002.1 hypothetical protein FHK87_21500 [Aquimarina algicola]